MKTINYNTKIKYLLISLEILNTQEWLCTTIKKNNSLIYYRYSNQNIYSLITSINGIKNNSYIYEFIILILKKKKLLKKYIKKFQYIHNKRLQYYHISSLHDKLNIHNIAIINLYIIYKFLKHNNISYIILYLLF